MKNILGLTIVLVLLPLVGLAQEESVDQYLQGYGFIAPGVAVGQGQASGFLHFGGGGEVNLYKGIGFGAEVGYAAPFEYTGSGIGVLSVNGLYKFRRQGATKVEPFVSGGYSLLFRSGHLNAMNFGGGVHYWLSKRIGLRLEVRDHFSPEYFSDHLIQGRVGISFR
jgi:hypothetical protein